MDMRKLKVLIILVLSFALVLTGCSKEEQAHSNIINEEENNQVADNDESEEKEISENEEREKEEVESESVKEESHKEELDEKESDKDETDKVESSLIEQEETSEDEDVKMEDKEEIKEEETEEVEEAINMLKIEGEVDNPLSLSLDDLKDMEDIIFEGDFYSLNNFGTTEHTHFKGVNLWGLLNIAQISPEAKTVRIIATDGYEMEFTVEEVKKQDYIDETNPDVKLPMIIAWEEDGEEYDSEEGPPYKLVVGQKEPGDINKPQWVSNIDRIVVE